MKINVLKCSDWFGIFQTWWWFLLWNGSRMMMGRRRLKGSSTCEVLWCWIGPLHWIGIKLLELWHECCILWPQIIDTCWL